MSRKKDENYFEDEDMEADVKCPPLQVLWSNLNEEMETQKHDEAVVMEEGVSFKEKEEITREDAHNLVAEEGIGIEYPDTSGGQRVASPSRPPDVSPSAAALGSRVHNPAIGRRTRIPERVSPGAFREGGPDNEEGHDEDELTIESHTEPPIPPTLSAELVNTEEEEKRVEDKVNQALQRQHQLVQDQIDQALQRQLQQAVVAEVVPEVASKRDRRWKVAAAFLLLLSAVGMVLGITLRPDTDSETFIPKDLIDFLSNASSDSGEALRNSSTPQYEALEWLSGDANLTNYTDQEKIQRYALATLYYSTKGDGWTRRDKWLSDADVCGQWYQYDNKTINCTSAGEVSSLSLTNNNLIGTIPAEIGMLTDSLERLWLDSNKLSGTVPTGIASLTKLKQLSLYENVLKGTIPTELGLLSNLGYLALDSNQLAGTFPTNLGSLSLLKDLHLNENVLNGTIPTELGLLSSLEWLDLASNLLTSMVPTSLASLPRLKWLYLDDNVLSDTIPTELGLLSNLEFLSLHSNQFNGTFPTNLGSLSLLKELYLYENVLSDTIPTEIGLLRNLEMLSLYLNQLTGTFPTSLGGLSLLKVLNLYENVLNGTIPTELGLLSNLEWLELDSNRLTGMVPTNLGSLSLLKDLLLYKNVLSDTIPTELGLLSNLEFLSLHSNQFNGTIPTELGLLNNLGYLDLSSNQLTGTVPTSLASLPLLKDLYLNDNVLTGSLDAFCGISSLEFAANTCGQDEIECACCTHCCEPGICCELETNICYEF